MKWEEFALPEEGTGRGGCGTGIGEMGMKEKWWHDLIGYQIYPKSFQDTNSDGTGDIPGVIQRLDYLSDLGISMIWICPIYRSPMMDNGYDISDYTQIDSVFGTNEDLKKLIGEAKKRGITIIMDLVINHTSSAHPWFQEACKDPEGEYGKYYILRKGKNGQPPNNWRSLFGGSAWEKIEGSEYYYLHLFTVGQPDLNWENEKLRRALYKMINDWLEMGIGGFRIDAIAHIKKDLTCGHLPADGPDGLCSGMRYFRNVEGIEDYLKELKEQTFEKYDCFTLAEVDNIPEERLEAYIGENGYYSTVFDFCHCFHNCLDGEWKGRHKEMLLDVRNRVFERQKRMEGKGFFCNYQENHDMIRIPDRFLPREKQNFHSLSMLPVMYFFLPGIPMLYQGQEIGMTGFCRERIEDYVDLATHNNYQGYLSQGMTKEQALEKINHTSRENARTPMQWNDGPNAGFSDEAPWFAPNPDYQNVNVEKQQQDDGSLLKFYQKLIALRKHCLYQKNWVYGSFTALEEESDQLWCYMRCRDGQRLQVFVNMSDECVLTKGCYDGKVLVNNYVALSQKAGCLLLQPYQAVVLAVES